MIGRLMVEAVFKIAMFTVFAVIGSDMPQTDWLEYTPYTYPAQISYIETGVEHQGNTLIFGNLVMEFPEDVTVEIKASTAAEGGQIITLNRGAEVGGVPYSPQIYITRYMAEYERDEALISALLDLVEGEELRYQYKDDENKEYIFRLGYGSNHKKYYVLVRGEDLYLIGELDIEGAFSALREQGNVKWQDTSEAIEKEQYKYPGGYFKLEPEEGMTFICYRQFGQNSGDNAHICLYLDGYLGDNSYSDFEVDGYVHMFSNYFRDINFDGYTDIDLNYDYALIWNPANKDFVKVKYPENMPYFEWYIESFPETRTVWGYNINYLSEEKSDKNKDYIETLWQWEGFTPVKKRECREEFREDGVRLWAYGESTDDIMFDESFNWNEWDNSSEAIQRLFEQFYDGLAPKDFFYPKAKGLIPQGLLNKLTDALLHNTEVETLAAIVKSLKLTNEEAYTLVEENTNIRSSILSGGFGDIGICTIASEDIDNDGIEDIIVEYIGWITLFKGQPDGTYEYIVSWQSVSRDVGIINYNGKNYIIDELCDYRQVLFNGYRVTMYEDGHPAEAIELTLYAEDYDLTLLSSEDKYVNYANDVMENAVNFDKLVDKRCNVDGNAEAEMEDNIYSYSCDLDNDGIIEYYDKYIQVSISNNMYNTWDTLIFNGEDDEGIDLIDDAIRELSDSIMFWADEVDNETVVNVMYRTSLEDFMIVGYVVMDSEIQEVYRINADAVYGVKQTQVRVD